MSRQRYSKRESENRILRELQANPVPQDTPETVPGTVLSEDEALSDLAELLAGSLPGYTLVIPLYPVESAPTGTPITLGGYLYAQDGALKWYGSSGTITVVAGS